MPPSRICEANSPQSLCDTYNRVPTGDNVRVSISRAIACLVIAAAMALPAFGMSAGPSALNSNDDLTVKYGCSCHNNGAVSDRAVVMITGVPLLYEPSEQYVLTINVADSLTFLRIM